MAGKCHDCPFMDDGPGLFLRRSLCLGRWRSILFDLRKGLHFTCHETTEETGNGTNLVCAGSIEWQDKHECTSAYVQMVRMLFEGEST